MRPTKFKAWDSVEKKWWTDRYETDERNMLILCKDVFYIQTEFLTYGEVYRVIRIKLPSHYKVVWSTGLLDKNRKEIYEGDILHIELVGGQEYTQVVVWDDRDAAFALSLGPPLNLIMLTAKMMPVGEVIGNIYENPELLKEKGD